VLYVADARLGGESSLGLSTAAFFFCLVAGTMPPVGVPLLVHGLMAEARGEREWDALRSGVDRAPWRALPLAGWSSAR